MAFFLEVMVLVIDAIRYAGWFVVRNTVGQMAWNQHFAQLCGTGLAKIMRNECRDAQLLGNNWRLLVDRID